MKPPWKVVTIHPGVTSQPVKVIYFSPGGNWTSLRQSPILLQVIVIGSANKSNLIQNPLCHTAPDRWQYFTGIFKSMESTPLSLNHKNEWKEHTQPRTSFLLNILHSNIWRILQHTHMPPCKMKIIKQLKVVLHVWTEWTFMHEKAIHYTFKTESLKDLIQYTILSKLSPWKI
jgi:hypothetical protein